MVDGDSISVDPMLNRFENRVQIRGAVYRPGLYDLGKVTTVKELIEKAEGITEDAFVNRAVLFRQKPDLTQEVVALNVTGRIYVVCKRGSKGTGSLQICR